MCPRRDGCPVRRRLAALGALAWAALPSCADELPPLGHVVVHVDTDAPLPPAPGEAPSGPWFLFDRVRIDVFEAGADEPCRECTREFDLDERTVREGASFTIVAPVGTAPRARFRLFRGVPLGPDPAAESTVELVVRMPPVPSEGAVDVTALLATESVGAPTGTLDEPEEATLGWGGAGRPGSWRPALRAPCAGSPRPGEVCIPGGAFWMGNRSMPVLPGRPDANVERLVALSPFFMDVAEVTVKAFRDAGIEGVIRWSGEYGTGWFADNCTFTAEPDDTHDALPVNCVTHAAATSYCAEKGARLPSEAEYEFVAGVFASQIHPWGTDEPTCADAVWGRPYAASGSAPPVAQCFVPLSQSGPAALFDARGAPRPGRDRAELTDGAVFDLAGNVREWTRDLSLASCWTRTGGQLFVDPECAGDPRPGGAHIVRGGSWRDPAFYTRAALRQEMVDTMHTTDVGFRCVRAADPAR
jgi:formylglycine-generating enzyme